MGWFTKEEKKNSMPELPRLPTLPSLPTSGLPELPNEDYSMHEPLIKDLPETRGFPELPNEEPEVHQLPSFPNSEAGDKFSQESIKNAIKGPEIDEEALMEHGPTEFNMMTEPMEKDAPMERRIIPRDEPMPELKTPEYPTIESEKKSLSNEPIFVRIDKFEDGLHIFDGIKNKLTEIEHLLSDTKELKDRETEELARWEHEIHKLKTQIEKVDKDIFSKVE